MSLIDKIESIRQKTENEKIKYVWMMVVISMFFVIFVWIFSLRDLMQGTGEINSGSDSSVGVESLEKTGEINNNNDINKESISNDLYQSGI